MAARHMIVSDKSWKDDGGMGPHYCDGMAAMHCSNCNGVEVRSLPGVHPSLRFREFVNDGWLLLHGKWICPDCHTTLGDEPWLAEQKNASMVGIAER